MAKRSGYFFAASIASAFEVGSQLNGGWIRRGVDAGLGHFGEQLLGAEALDLAMAAARRNDGLRPEMNLGVDDLHANL